MSHGLFYNYDYFLHPTDLDHNLFNVNTSLVFSYFYCMALLSQCNVLDSILIMAAHNLYFVYHNYARKTLLNQKPHIYYPLYCVYFISIIIRLRGFSYFGFIFSIYMSSLFLIVFPLLVKIGDRFRARWEGPFSLPLVRDYSFEIYHVLLE